MSDIRYAKYLADRAIRDLGDAKERVNHCLHMCDGTVFGPDFVDVEADIEELQDRLNILVNQMTLYSKKQGEQ